MRNRQTLLWKLLRNFLILTAVQIAIIAVVAAALGIFESGYTSSYHAFSYNLEVRAEMLEKMFQTVTRDLTNEGTRYSEYINETMTREGITASSLIRNQELLDEIFLEKSDDIISYLVNHDEVLGAFILLGTESLPEEGDVSAPGVYIRKDSVYTRNDLTWDNWYLQAGNPKIADRHNIRYYHLWDYSFRIADAPDSGDNREFFNVPLAQAARDGAGYYYISSLFRLHENGEAITTVTVPLLDQRGRPYGVVGASFYLGSTLSNISSISLSNVSRGFYTISGSRDKDFSGTVIASNSLGEAYLSSGELSSTLVSQEYDIYRYKNTAPQTENMVAMSQPLNFYEPDSPYYNQGYVLHSFVSEEELYADVNNFTILAGLFFASFVIFSTIAIIFVSIQISKPVIRLADQVSNIDADDVDMVLEPTGITEIDLLVSALRLFSEKLVQSASRFSSIIDLLEKPIGGFEENYTEHRVYITESISRIFNMPLKGKFYISHQEWKQLRDSLSRESLEEYPDIYRLPGANGQDRYLQLTTRKEENRVLGLVMDVTQEIREKTMLKAERDTDSLTGLLNRRGFQSRMLTVLKQLPEETVGAMIFLDLDNLKTVNDRYGHRAGDEYLRSIAMILGTQGGSSVSCRLSGDEFAIFLYGVNQVVVRAAVEQLFQRITETYIILPDNSNWYLKCSAGIAWYPEHTSDYRTLLKYADYAMYQVKHSTKNDYREFAPGDYHPPELIAHR